MLTTNRPASLPERCFSHIELPITGKIIVAFSGGGDSTALLYLAQRYLRIRGQADRLVAITVDHGLRAEAAAEAEMAGEFCGKLGVPHSTKRWKEAKPASGLQEAARLARYSLLAEAADEAGARIVLTGHTLDDQCETIAMRGARAKGRGLSGIAPATLYERRIWFVRPLLAVSRAALRAHVAEMGGTWLEDPSNLDAKFERVRIRQSGAATPGLNASVAHKTAFEARRMDAAAAAAVISDPQIWQFGDGGRCAVLATNAAHGNSSFGLALASVLGLVGNRAYLPSGETLGKAVSFVFEARNGEQLTLAGCLIAKHANAVRIEAETRNRRERGFGFDRLLPVSDYALADALSRRRGEEMLPAPPVSGYPS